MTMQIPESDKIAMAKAYPTWRPHSHGRYGGWEGILRPLPPGSDVRAVLGAIKHGQGLKVLPGGELVPVDPAAGARNLPGWLQQIRELPGSFRIRVHYEEPPTAPSAVCLAPLISWRRFPRHPHLYFSDDPPDFPAILCPFLPSDGDWVFGKNDIAQFIHLVAVWLVCHQVYAITGKWPSDAASHDPRWLLQNVKPEAVPCVCGNPIPYQQCCRPRHILQVRLGRMVR